MWLWHAHNVVSAVKKRAPKACVKRAGEHDPKHPRFSSFALSVSVVLNSAGVGDIRGMNRTSPVLDDIISAKETPGHRLQAATKNAEFLMPFTDASSSRFRDSRTCARL